MAKIPDRYQGAITVSDSLNAVKAFSSCRTGANQYREDRSPFEKRWEQLYDVVRRAAIDFDVTCLHALPAILWSQHRCVKMAKKPIHSLTLEFASGITGPQTDSSALIIDPKKHTATMRVGHSYNGPCHMPAVVVSVRSVF
jgi:hypothetical protein